MISSKDFNLSVESSESLVALHQKLDEGIIGKRGANTGNMTLAEAKVYKCLIKTELAVRAKKGDALALAYAKKRKWEMKVAVLSAIAAE